MISGRGDRNHDKQQSRLELRMEQIVIDKYPLDMFFILYHSLSSKEL